MKAKTGDIERDKTRIDVNFKMATGPDMSLPVSLILHHLSTKLILHFYVALGVSVGVSAVCQYITSLTYRIKLPDLNVSLHRWEGSFTIRRDTKTCRISIK